MKSGSPFSAAYAKREPEQVPAAISEPAQTLKPARVECLQHVMRDIAMFELFGQMPAPQLGHSGVGRLEQVVDLPQEELGLDDPNALEALAIGEALWCG